MPGPLLVIGNKTYSSWSFRPWLLLSHCGVPFRELRLPLDSEEFRRRIGEYSPTRRVPVLLDGDVVVWESLAICEYASERFEEVRGWPAARDARATARAAACEMHAGFAALRRELPFNCRALGREVSLSAECRADIDRIVRLWEASLSRHGGPWLFGEFGIADAMYAPVAVRFAGYGIPLPAGAAAWADRLAALPAFQSWMAAAGAETEVIEADERG